MNQGNNSEKWVVWYDGILDDLKLVTYLDNQLTEEERLGRAEALKRLNEKGVELPEMSIDPMDVEKYGNRQKVRSAVEFLRNRDLTEFKNWKSREEALDYLTSLEIGEGTEVGVDLISKLGEADESGDDLQELRDNPEIAKYPLLEGATLKPFVGMDILMKLILVPEYRETEDYLEAKAVLEKAGIDVEAAYRG